MGDTGTEGCSEELCQCGRKGRGSRCLPCPLPPFMAVTCELRERSVPLVFPSLQPQECILPLPPEVPGWEAMACFCLLSYPGMPICDPCCWAMRGAIALLRCWTRFFSMLSRIFASLFIKDSALQFPCGYLVQLGNQVMLTSRKFSSSVIFWMGLRIGVM